MSDYAVIVIDMLYEFVRGRLKAPNAEKIIPKIQELLINARNLGIPVIYTVDTHYKSIDFELALWGPHAIKGSEEHRIIDELKPENKDYIVYKRRYDSFFMTDLDLLLKELGVRKVILTGIHTHICVLATALGAFYRGYKIIIPQECVAAATEDWHKIGLDYMRNFLGAEITSCSQLIEKLKVDLKSEDLSPRYL